MLHRLKAKVKYFAKKRRTVECFKQTKSIPKGWEWKKRFGLETSSVCLEGKVCKFVSWGRGVQVLKKKSEDVSRGVVSWVKEFDCYPETNRM